MCLVVQFLRKVKMANKKIRFEAKDDQRRTIKHSNTVWFGKQNLLEPLSVTTIRVTTKRKGYLYFDSDINLVTQECLLAKGIVEAILMAYFFWSLRPLQNKTSLTNKRCWDVWTILVLIVKKAVSWRIILFKTQYYRRHCNRTCHTTVCGTGMKTM